MQAPQSSWRRHVKLTDTWQVHGGRGRYTGMHACNQDLGVGEFSVGQVKDMQLEPLSKQACMGCLSLQRLPQRDAGFRSLQLGQRGRNCGSHVGC